jgi:hypothetical protein
VEGSRWREVPPKGSSQREVQREAPFVVQGGEHEEGAKGLVQRRATGGRCGRGGVRSKHREEASNTCVKERDEEDGVEDERKNKPAVACSYNRLSIKVFRDISYNVYKSVVAKLLSSMSPYTHAHSCLHARNHTGTVPAALGHLQRAN